MKKVLILAVVLMLVVTSMAVAGIRFSKHDMSSSSTNSSTRVTNQDDLCVFCHTPHASNTAMTAAPLWNRTSSQSWTNNAAYSSATLNGTAVGPNNANALSLACLGCHDGNVATETLVNGPGSGTASTLTWQNSQFTTVANLNDAGVGLTNDHPIGVAFPNAADLGLYASVLNTNIIVTASGVQCSSCHDVHTPGTGSSSPFLVMSNAGSAMCLACHNK